MWSSLMPPNSVCLGTTEWSFMTFYIWEFMKNCCIFYLLLFRGRNAHRTYIDVVRSSLNIYQSKKLYRKIKYMLSVLCTLSISLCAFWDNWTHQIQCVHFQISVSNNHHSFLIIPQTWIVCVSWLYVHFFTFVYNGQYTGILWTRVK
jgi:hypothetical protein